MLGSDTFVNVPGNLEFVVCGCNNRSDEGCWG